MDLKEIKRLIQMVEDAKISALALESDGIKIEIKKEAPVIASHQGATEVVVAAPQPVVVATSSVPEAAGEAAAKPALSNHSNGSAEAGLVVVKSPMVGTFYTSSNPETPAYVKVGDSVSKGQILCIVEAMKLFNEIECEVSGTIEKILVDNSQPVEYGQELFVIRP